MTRLDDLPVDRLSPSGDRRMRMTPQVIVGYIGALVTILGLVFTAGVEWNKVSEVRDIQDKFAVDYVRKDVNKEQMITLETKLNEISSQLAALQQRGMR